MDHARKILQSCELGEGTLEGPVMERLGRVDCFLGLPTLINKKVPIGKKMCLNHFSI